MCFPNFCNYRQFHVLFCVSSCLVLDFEEFLILFEIRQELRPHTYLGRVLFQIRRELQAHIVFAFFYIILSNHFHPHRS